MRSYPPRRPTLVGVKKKLDRRERVREAKALSAAKLERSIEAELLARLKSKAYGDMPLNVNEDVWAAVLERDRLGEEGEELEDEGEEEEEVEYDEDEDEDGLEESEEERGFVEDDSEIEESDDEDDMEDFSGEEVSRFARAASHPSDSCPPPADCFSPYPNHPCSTAHRSLTRTRRMALAPRPTRPTRRRPRPSRSGPHRPPARRRPGQRRRRRRAAAAARGSRLSTSTRRRQRR